MSPAISIVGSVEPSRAAELGLEDPDAAPEACAQLGRVLAHRGCSIIVYSSDPRFIEGDVVRGYVASGEASGKSIDVRYPPQARGRFPELQTDRSLFVENPDVSRSWEVSFYRSLYAADGIVLVGGGASTLITGLIALSFRKPLMAIGSFGGKAAEVREEFARVRNDATEEHLAAMGRSWTDGSADELVDGLLAQISTRAANDAAAAAAERERAKHKRLSLWIGAAALVAALAAIPVVYGTDPGGLPNLVALLVGPLLAGVCGAIIRNAIVDGTDWLQTGILGLGAGVISMLLFVASQLATSPNALKEDGVRTLVVFVLSVGFVAGLTFDIVYGKLRQQDVANTKLFEQP